MYISQVYRPFSKSQEQGHVQKSNTNRNDRAVVTQLASHLWDQSLNSGLTSSGKDGSCLLLVSSLHYRTLTNCMYWFCLPFQLPITTLQIRNYMWCEALWITLQAVSPVTTSIWLNLPVLGSPADVCRQPCESVANCSLPCVSYLSFKIFEVSVSGFCTVSMPRCQHVWISFYGNRRCGPRCT